MKRRRPFDYLGPPPGAFDRPPPPAEPAIDAAPDNDLDIAPEPSMRPRFSHTPPPPLEPVSTQTSSLEPPAPESEPLDLAEPVAVDAPPVVEAPPPRVEPTSPPPVAAPAAEHQFRAPTLEKPKPESRAVFGFAILFAIAIGLAPATFWIGAMTKTGPFQYEPFTFGLLALLGAGIAGLALALAYSIRQGSRLAAEARMARKQAEDMLQPALLAAAGAGSAIEAVRLEIEGANAAAARAQAELTRLREAMASESALLLEAASESAKSAGSITAAFGQEREGMSQMSAQLERQINDVGDAIGKQAKMVSEASDLAEAQIREAEAALTARAADLVAAAGQTTDAARIATEDLTRQTARLETAATAIGEQINGLEGGLAEQRAALVAVSHAMRADQEDFAAQIETQQAQLSRLLQEAHSGLSVLQDITNQGAETARGLIGDVAEQYKALTTSVAAEREQLKVSTDSAIGDLAEAVRREREVLETSTRETIEAMKEAAEGARAAAADHAQTAKQRVEELGEAAFAAGQRADAVFEQRLSEAQALIAQSAALVEEAGRKAGERMGASLEAAKAAAADIEALIAQVEERTARLPADAQERTKEVKAVVDQGVDELLGAARKAAEETQAIDEAFQERVRRNYEMLSEAVRLMGVVSGVAAPSRPLRPSARKMAEADGQPSDEAPAPTLSFRGARQTEPADGDIGLRPRLKLTPTAESVGDLAEAEAETVEPDESPEPGQVASTTAEPAADDGEGWTWKDLLSSIDGQPAAPDRLGERMLEEVEALGIDPVALMPGGRIDQIAAVLQSGDRTGAREVVRRLAPAAVRRLSRRVMADLGLRTQTERFLKRYEETIAEVGSAGGEGEAVAEVLASDQGRAFLLMDAAVGGLS